MKTPETIRYVTAPTNYGDMLVACSDDGVCAILLGAEGIFPNRTLTRRFPRAMFVHDATLLPLAQRIGRYVDEPTSAFEAVLDLRGTDFQKRVWRALMAVPCGETATYTDIANAIGAPKSVRAVGAACGANMHAIIVPCHRIVRTDGGLAGFRWGGPNNKRILLNAERGASPADSAQFAIA